MGSYHPEYTWSQGANKGVVAGLLDCQMPVMDGYEATRIIRKMRGL